MLFRTLDELDGAVRPALACDRQGVREILDGDALRADLVDRLAYNAVFQPDVEIKSHVRFLIRSAAARLGIFPASLHALYAEKSRGRHTHFTTPAVNLRALTYDGARAVFEAARELDAGAFIFEIARSEIGYTEQRPVGVRGGRARGGHQRRVPRAPCSCRATTSRSDRQASSTAPS